MDNITKYAIAVLLALVAIVGLGGVIMVSAAPAVIGDLYLRPTRQPGDTPRAQSTPQPGQMPQWKDERSWGRERGMLVGKVAAVSADTLTLTTAYSRTITTTITSQTKIYGMPGQSARSLNDIEVGDTVRVMGRQTSGGAVEAQTIMVGPVGETVGGPVTAVNGATITIQAGCGVTATVVTDANTQFTLAGGQAGSLADVKVGVFVKASGQSQTDGALLAAQVVIGNQPRSWPQMPERRPNHGGWMGPGY